MFKIKKRQAFVLAVTIILLASLFLAACSKMGSGEPAELVPYEVTLPGNYETDQRNYPVVYVLPQDGYHADDSGIVEMLHEYIEAIIVRPVFEADTNIHGAMETLVQHVDGTYRTIADKKYRALVGTGTGGYLSYVLGLTEAKDKVLKESETFSGVVSIRGDFASEENPWKSAYGDAAEIVDKLHKKSKEGFDTFYTYLDAPVEDSWSNMGGSTNDIGKLFIEYGTASNRHEFTVRKGSFTEEFLTESVMRVADRLNTYMLSDVATGFVALEKGTLTEAEKTAVANYTIEISDEIKKYITGNTQVRINILVLDSQTGDVLDCVSKEEKITEAGTYTGTMEVANLVNGSYSNVQLELELFGANMLLGTAYLSREEAPVIDGDYQKLNLAGDWYFNYVGKKKTLDVAALTAEEYRAWSVVQPGMGNWTKGYGNISDETVNSLMGDGYFDYMIVGSGYYVKEFHLPQDFDSKELVLSIGYVDDRCEVFLNGVRVGATGMDEKGKPTDETTWAQYSTFTITPDMLKYNDTNTVVVRAWNDEPYGAGGWYGGPIGLYSKKAFADAGKETGDSEGSRFIEKSFASEYAASALKQSGTIENEYLVYLPKDYYESENYYPTVYLLHQFNSDHTSYSVDKIDQILDKGMEEGLFDEMIVIVPNSDENSWWAGDWELMITEELIPLIDSQYRTIRDARYRLTAGCSMGGQGAFSVALRNPDYFSGAISFFGAFSYGEKNSPNHIAAIESTEYIDSFTMYFICGNQDSYGFGVPAIELNQLLEEKGIEHGFFIENGGHDGEFYLPYFAEAFAYTREHMYHVGDEEEAVLTGELALDVGTGKVTAKVEAASGIEAYFYEIPESSYTKNANPKLSIPLLVQLVQDGEVIHEYVERDFCMSKESKGNIYQYDFSQYVEEGKSYTIVYKAALFDKIIILDEVLVDE